jgi:uncharacterized membrane protein
MRKKDGRTPKKNPARISFKIKILLFCNLWYLIMRKKNRTEKKIHLKLVLKKFQNNKKREKKKLRRAKRFHLKLIL